MVLELSWCQSLPRRRMWLTNLCLALTNFPPFFSLFFSILVPNPLNFQSSPSICSLYVKFGNYSFYYYLFYLRNFLRFFFLWFHPRLIFFLIKFDFIIMIVIVFSLTNFLNWFFKKISSFNIKLVGNWIFFYFKGCKFEGFTRVC